MNLIKPAISANFCQRNWDNTLVSKNDLTTILESATNMPSKQNFDYYSIVASQNKSFNNFCYRNATHENATKPVNRNSQVLAPTLLLWIEHKNVDNNHSQFTPEDRDIAIGISSGVAAYVANMLNYKTGFCRCIMEEPICNELKTVFNIEANRVLLMLGIGKPNLNYNHNDIVVNDIVVRTVETIKKNTIYYLI